MAATEDISKHIVLKDIDTFDGKQGHKLDDWLTDVENAAAL